MNILLIQIMRLGDAVQMIPVIQGLKSLFPQSRIHVLTSFMGRRVFEMEPAVEGLHVLDKQAIKDLVCRSGKKDLLQAIECLRAELRPLLQVQWDRVINFSFSYPSALLSFLTACGCCSGFTVTGQRRFLSKEPWFAHSLASFSKRRYSNFNWVDINRKIISLPSVPSPPFLKPKPETLRAISSLLNSIGFQEKRIIAMHPGASGDHKRWPLEKFGELGRSIVSREGHGILILGSGDERDLGERLKILIGPGAESIVGQTTVEELTACLSRCSLLVSNDSGPMHLAASVSTPIVGLFFNTHFMETGPYGPGHVVLHPDLSCFPCQGPAKCSTKECLNHISPETVAKILFGGHETESDWMGKNSERVRAYRSSFDPWGFLDWTPAGRSPIRFDDMERLLLRVSWLFQTGCIGENDGLAGDYLKKTVDAYELPEDRSMLLEQLDRLRLNLLDFRAGLHQAGRVIVQMQGELSKEKPLPGTVEGLGKRLARIEGESAAISRKEPSLGFLSDLLALLSDNLEATNLLDLSMETGRIYTDMTGLTDAMIRYAGPLGECFNAPFQQRKGSGWKRQGCG